MKVQQEINQLICYSEVGSLNKNEYNLFNSGEKKLWDWTKLIEDKSFKRVRLEKVNLVWPAFRKLFGGRKNVF